MTLRPSGSGSSEAGIGDDDLHVAIATVYRADIIVSWNFKHIVQRRRIHGFDAVSTLMDYRPPDIFSPREIIEV